MSIVKKTIKELQPHLKHLNLTFELYSISSCDQNSIHCSIIDPTGMVNAYFNQYVDMLTVGSVYTMTELKVRVIDGYMRIQMGKNSIVEKEPFKIGFKDKSNNMSQILYAKKKEFQFIFQNINKKSNISEKDSHLKDKVDKSQKIIQENDKTSQYIPEKSQLKRQKSPYINEYTSPKNINQQKYFKNNLDNKVQTNHQLKHQKIQYKQKKETIPQNTSNKIKLRQICDNNKLVTVQIWIQKQDQKKKNGWIVADESGSMVAIINEDRRIDKCEWYEFENMEVFCEQNQFFLRDTNSFFSKMFDSKKRYNLNPISSKNQ